MKHITVAIDHSECSNRAIAQAKELAKLYGAKLTLLHVYDNKYFDTFLEGGYNRLDVIEKMRHEVQDQSASLLAAAKEQCADLETPIETISLEGYAAGRIIDFVENNDVDLLVMGSHGMGGFRRFFLGSVTHKVAVSIEKPILIVR